MVCLVSFRDFLGFHRFISITMKISVSNSYSFSYANCCHLDSSVKTSFQSILIISFYWKNSVRFDPILPVLIVIALQMLVRNSHNSHLLIPNHLPPSTIVLISHLNGSIYNQVVKYL